MLEGLGFKVGFIGALLLIATFVLPLIVQAVRKRVLVYRVRHRFRETLCTVESKELGIESGSRTVTHLGGGHQHSATEAVVLYKPLIRYHYSANGGEYESIGLSPTAEASADRGSAVLALSHYSLGTRYQCWYDPEHPESAFLERP
jgi:uncharacterized protein DUF3592